MDFDKIDQAAWGLANGKDYVSFDGIASKSVYHSLYTNYKRWLDGEITKSECKAEHDHLLTEYTEEMKSRFRASELFKRTEPAISNIKLHRPELAEDEDVAALIAAIDGT